jgi:glycogen operon protein
MKNMLAVLLTSRGIPMLLSGDEFANTQYGNNNAYCQDNEISWLDWGRLKTHGELFEYVRQLIAFRKAHPVLRADGYDFSNNGTGYPELSFHGTLAWNIDEHAPGLSFAYMYAEDHVKYGTAQDAFIYVAVNAYWEAQRYTLPMLPPGYRWQPALALPEHPEISRPENGPSVLPLGPRSTAVLIGVPK